jgi:hypothetical protein
VKCLRNVISSRIANFLFLIVIQETCYVPLTTLAVKSAKYITYNSLLIIVVLNILTVVYLGVMYVSALQLEIFIYNYYSIMGLHHSHTW